MECLTIGRSRSITKNRGECYLWAAPSALLLQYAVAGYLLVGIPDWANLYAPRYRTHRGNRGFATVRRLSLVGLIV